MKRPMLMRWLPERLRNSVWARCYQGRHREWAPLYESAELTAAPGVQMELVPGDIISDAIAFTGVYEAAATRRLLHLARSGGTLIDVGANLGYFSLLWAAANPANRCIAIEASPRNLEILGRNLLRNGLERRVQVVPCAAGRAPGTLKFDPGPADQTGWGGFSADGGGLEVEVVRIDDVVTTADPIALLKVDIEGADAWALLGCERLLKTGQIREVWFELNKPRMRALGIHENAAQDFLSSLGYVSLPNGDPRGEFVEWTAQPK